MRNRGFYAGTLRPNQPWYKRRVASDAFPAEGPGEYWYDYKGFYFTSAAGGPGLMIPLGSVVDVKIGRLHGLTFNKGKMLKIAWKNGSQAYSSGFVVQDPELVRQALITPGWA